jgi:cytochrome c551
MTTRRRRVLAAGSILAIGLGAAACGSEEISLKAGESDQVSRGATLFAQRCAGCHTLDVAGAQGGATRIHDRERVDGPNFNVRKEDRDSVLYAIRNGGFSGAVMPENIVVGKDAEAVAAFLAKYAGSQGKSSVTPSQPVQANQGGQQQQQTTSTPEAAAANGKQIFTDNCAACHTLKDANASGQVGPNLDDAKPDEATTEKQVTNGGGAMPPFKGTLSDDEIKAISQYVASVAGK